MLNGFMYSALWNDSVRPSEEANALQGTHVEKGKMRVGSWGQGLLHSTAYHGVQQQSPGKAAVNGRPGHSSTLAGIRVTAGRTEYLNVTLQGAQRPAGPMILKHEGLASKREWDVCGS